MTVVVFNPCRQSLGMKWVFITSRFANVCSQIKQIGVRFTHVVGRGSETQLLVGENLFF